MRHDGQPCCDGRKSFESVMGSGGGKAESRVFHHPARSPQLINMLRRSPRIQLQLFR